MGMLMPTSFRTLVQVRMVRSPLEVHVYLLPEHAGVPVGDELPHEVGVPP